MKVGQCIWMLLPLKQINCQALNLKFDLITLDLQRIIYFLNFKIIDVLLTWVHSCHFQISADSLCFSFAQMPRIWLDFCHFLTDQCRITRTRQVFDRALRALPITQHHRIWPLYLGFMKKHDIPETAVRVFRRYLKVGKGLA